MTLCCTSMGKNASEVATKLTKEMENVVNGLLTQISHLMLGRLLQSSFQIGANVKIVLTFMLK